MGDIGLPMAKRIAEKFPTTIVGHRRREPIEEMKSLGATEVKTAREVGEASDAVVIMVQNDNQAEEGDLWPRWSLGRNERGFRYIADGHFSSQILPESV